MQQNPYMLLFGLAAAIWLGAQTWRRRKLKRAVRDLPTLLQRQLGPEPDYLPPEHIAQTPELAAYARLHQRTARVQRALWGLAGLWLLFVIFLVLREHIQ
ncbi:hypothetical protein [Pseudoruegeria sp. SHC-113]|uniref:hypothetical protein n=1 Tax=Pseudoruegeria sp. SHC-113 TaxID=2855439 RepID=UPI0021BA9D95|nr:hypothetical protein [Pseudoruegeria sp. SHC-113]MCT8159236.1 hypothetical protein [Pseudoruegeria sp. SHC-113]